MKLLIQTWTAIGMLALGLSASAQQPADTAATITRPVQLTLISPVGSNGLESAKVTNNFSLNLIAGVSGGLDGVELSSFASVVNGDVRGAQFAGFGNAVMGNSQGGQFAGFYNVNRGAIDGGQFSGFVNVIGQSSRAGQFAGFVNVVHGHLQGVQAAGFVNAASGGVRGVQISGFANATHKNIQGAQLTGFANAINGDLKGFQAAGFANVVHGNVKGAQVSGFTNVASGSVTGTQISGFVNYARYIKGSQIGFINVADSMDGMPIGFLSVVRNGYHKVEVGGDESLWGSVRVKTGVDKFYNILGVGGRTGNDGFLWGYGYGVGTLLPVSGNLKANADAVVWHLHEDGAWNGDLNLLTKLNVALVYPFNDQLEIFGGPTFNFLISDRTDREGRLIGSAAVPWSTWDDTADGGNYLLQAYPGFHFGIRL